VLQFAFAFDFGLGGRGVVGVGVARFGRRWRDLARAALSHEKRPHCVPLCYNVFSGDARHMISATRANIPALCGFVQFFGSIKNEYSSFCCSCCCVLSVCRSG